MDTKSNFIINMVKAIAAVVITAALLFGAYILLFGKEEKEAAEPNVLVGEIMREAESEEPEEALSTEMTVEQKEEPDDQDELQEPEKSEQILISSAVPEKERVALGIDVSKYQGNIDWKKVADSGIEFAMIRAGYRTTSEGEIIEDSQARYNLQEATANGILVGVYFFSTAVSREEALEEAMWVADLIAPYSVTFPVAYDCERYEKPESRQYYLTKEDRTEFAKGFMDKIYEFGYTPMIYASKGELEEDQQCRA